MRAKPIPSSSSSLQCNISTKSSTHFHQYYHSWQPGTPGGQLCSIGLKSGQKWFPFLVVSMALHNHRLPDRTFSFAVLEVSIFFNGLRLGDSVGDNLFKWIVLYGSQYWEQCLSSTWAEWEPMAHFMQQCRKVMADYVWLSRGLRVQNASWYCRQMPEVVNEHWLPSLRLCACHDASDLPTFIT